MGHDLATVLVTGGSGFIGRHLCGRLRALGATVHTTSRRAEPQEHPEDGASRWYDHWHQVDLSQGAAVDRLMDACRPQVVYHLASHVVGARDRSLVKSTFEANLSSTVHLLDATTRLQCRRFVQVGSLEEPDFDEPSAAPSSPYAAAKAAATAYARMYHGLYGTPVVLARLFMVYGPAQWAINKLIPYVILSLLRGERPELSSGQRPVDWIYVDDVVEGLVRLGQIAETASGDGIEGQRVDLGSGQLHTIRQVVEMLFRLCGEAGQEPTFGELKDRPQEQVRRALVETTRRQLGWQPQVSLEEGLRRTIAWYRDALASGRI